MSGHRKYSPSGAHRWLVCPASVQYQPEGDGDSFSSPYAQEGTMAHAVCHAMLADEPLPDGITDEMLEHCQGFAEWVNDQYEAESFFADHYERHLERYYPSSISSDYGGTADVTLVCDDLLWIIDLKYGSGVRVTAADNPQLLSYLLCAAEAFPQARRFRMTIYQPRTPGEAADTVDVTADELAEFRARVIDAMHRDEFKAGDHCRWCPGKPRCEHLYQLAKEAAQIDFTDEPTDAERVAWLLKNGKAIKALVDYAEDRAKEILKAGEPLEGYKLVEAIGNRCWSMDEIEIVKRLVGRRVRKGDLFAKVLRSPAQLEKQIDKTKFEDLVHRPSRGLTVVPSTDKRPAVSFSTASEDFEDGV